MRIFLFGSYTTGNARKESDIDVFLSDNELKGYTPKTRKSDSKELAILTDNFEPFSLEYNGRLDLFIDQGDVFQAIYDSERSLFGKDFLYRLEHEIQKYAKEITVDELEELLMLSTFEERLEMVSKILARDSFLS